MDFEHSQKVKDLQKRLSAFMDEHIYPNEGRFFREAEEVGPMKVAPVIEEIKLKGKAAGLWNLFLPHSEHGAGLTSSMTGATFIGPTSSASRKKRSSFGYICSSMKDINRFWRSFTFCV